VNKNDISRQTLEGMNNSETIVRIN